MQPNSQPDLTTLPLRQSHPSLFKSLMLKAIFIFTAGVFIATGNATYVLEETVLTRNGVVDSPLIPVELFGIAFIVVGLTLAYGITNGLRRYKWARRGMIAAASLCGIFAVGYWFAFIQDFTPRIFAPLLWSYMTGQFIIWAGEPAFNPLSSALNAKPKTQAERDISGV